MKRRTQAACLAALAAALPVVTAPAPAAAAETRYSLAGKCFALQASGAAVKGAERVRMQATDLGTYLLYLPDRTFLAAQDDGSVAPAAEPSPAADWRVADERDGNFTLAPLSAPDQGLTYNGSSLRVEGTPGTFTFAPATGCPAYPRPT